MRRVALALAILLSSSRAGTATADAHDVEQTCKVRDGQPVCVARSHTATPATRAAGSGGNSARSGTTDGPVPPDPARCGRLPDSRSGGSYDACSSDAGDDPSRFQPAPAGNWAAGCWSGGGVMGCIWYPDPTEGTSALARRAHHPHLHRRGHLRRGGH